MLLLSCNLVSSRSLESHARTRTFGKDQPIGSLEAPRRKRAVSMLSDDATTETEKVQLPPATAEACSPRIRSVNRKHHVLRSAFESGEWMTLSALAASAAYDGAMVVKDTKPQTDCFSHTVATLVKQVDLLHSTEILAKSMALPRNPFRRRTENTRRYVPIRKTTMGGLIDETKFLVL